MKIKVPKEMLRAALPFRDNQMASGLESALLWLSENPIVPTVEQAQYVADKHMRGAVNYEVVRDYMVGWVKIMFLAEPEVPEEVKDLLKTDLCSNEWNHAVLEAYRRGKESK